MARIRTIKPEFWLDEDLSELSCEAHMLAAALLNHCDDEGYFKANPKLIHAQIFALRELSGSASELLNNLNDIGYLTLFNGADGKVYGHVTNFNKHQTINKPTTSKIKGLKVDAQDYGNATVALPVGKERKGKEQGKEQGKESASVAQLPSNSKMFDEFYEAYPNKKDRKRAKVAFDKIRPDENLFLEIINGLKNQIAWRKEHPPGYFLPEWKNPSTWLNGENWQDVLESPSKKPTHRSGPVTVSDHNSQVMGEWLASKQSSLEGVTYEN